jgi:tRNA threonylcarbamoyladenosine biosynthesis protein TsaE
MILQKYLVANTQELPEVAEFLKTLLKNHSIICFEGSMGAGKTTLIKVLMAALGDDREVSSPTYSIVNEYLLKDGEKVFHFDFYRMKDMEEAMDIGCEEYFESGHTCLIEWPEIIKPLLPSSYISVHLTEVNGERLIEIKSQE